MSELILEKTSKLPLPKGWALTTLEDISLKLTAGGTPSTKIPKYYQNGTIPFVKIDDITDNEKHLDNTKTSITTEGLESCTAWIVPKNSILYSMYASYGIPIINKIPVTMSQAIIGFIPPHDYIDLNYVYYYLKFIKSKLKPKGTTQVNLNAGIIRNAEVKLSPLNEQKRIASKIEELFSILDNAKILLDKTISQIKQNKQSLLNSALTGNLTETWRKENKLELELNNNPLKNLIIFSKNGFTGRPNDQEKGTKRLGIETITGSNSIYVDQTKCKFIEIPSSKLESYRAKEGDLFVCRQNGNKNYVGKCAVFKGVNKPIIFSDSLIQLRINHNLILSEYLVHFLNSMYGRNQIEQYCSTTAGNFSINGTNLKKIIVSYPSILEQKIIISKIYECFSLMNNNKKLIVKPINYIQVLKSSILKQAFEGKLVPQDPNDEPASELLKRIKDSNS